MSTRKHTAMPGMQSIQRQLAMTSSGVYIDGALPMIYASIRRIQWACLNIQQILQILTILNVNEDD